MMQVEVAIIYTYISFLCTRMYNIYVLKRTRTRVRLHCTIGLPPNKLNTCENAWYCLECHTQTLGSGSRPGSTCMTVATLPSSLAASLIAIAWSPGGAASAAVRLPSAIAHASLVHGSASNPCRSSRGMPILFQTNGASLSTANISGNRRRNDARVPRSSSSRKTCQIAGGNAVICLPRGTRANACKTR